MSPLPNSPVLEPNLRDYFIVEGRSHDGNTTRVGALFSLNVAHWLCQRCTNSKVHMRMKPANWHMSDRIAFTDVGVGDCRFLAVNKLIPDNGPKGTRDMVAAALPTALMMAPDDRRADELTRNDQEQKLGRMRPT